MRVLQSKSFGLQAKKLSKEEQIKLKLILQSIQAAKSFTQINSTPILGFPFLHTIEFGEYVIGVQVNENGVELAGIVEKGKELSIFI